MQKPTEPKPFRWSFSQWENYQQCPRRWKHKTRDKLPTSPAGPAAQRGLEIHQTVEDYINGALHSTLHPAIAPAYQEVFDTYRLWPNGDRWTERKLGLGRDFGWAGSDSPTAYVIMVFDVMAFDGETVHIGEWKSGKPKETHRDQRSLYSLGALKWYPSAKQAIATTYYLEDTEVPQKLTVAATATPKLEAIWLQRAEQMEQDQICAPRPGFYCKWCDFSKFKGGPCQVG